MISMVEMQEEATGVCEHRVIWLQSPQCFHCQVWGLSHLCPDPCFWVTWSSSLPEGFGVDLAVPGTWFPSLPQLKGSQPIKVSADWETQLLRVLGPKSPAYSSQVPSYSPVSKADTVRAAAPSRSSLWSSCRRQGSIQALLCPTTGKICRIFSLGSFGRLGCRGLAKLAEEPARSKEQGEASQ